MASSVVIGLLIMVALRLGKACLDLTRNIQTAKQSGLPYVIGPFYPITYRWMITGEFIGLFLNKIPIVRSWIWLGIIDRQASYRKPRDVEDKIGDTYLLVGPGEFFLRSSNAELISQITTRHRDFPKPVWRFRIVDIFGKSILTAEEGEDWKRHHKIVGPSFSERSNRLVFEESLRQAEGMLSFWAEKSNKNAATGELRVSDTSGDTGTLTLHVICAAGFGIPQLWENQSAKDLGARALPGFSDDKLIGGHTLPFKKSLTTILSHILWFMVIPPRILRKLPFKGAFEASTAYEECMEYFHALLKTKRAEISRGEEGNTKTVDLLSPMIKASDGSSTSTTKNTENTTIPNFSTSEILGNSFIFLFAGHDTTASKIHFTLILLAMHLPSQRSLQNTISSIVGDKPTTEWSYEKDMPRLFNSMVGAVLHEALRLIPAVSNIPKVTAGNQDVTVDGKKCRIPDGTHVYMNIIGIHRNPRYWTDPSAFKPERWLSYPTTTKHDVGDEKDEQDDSQDPSFLQASSGSLLVPQKGTFIPFSLGTRSCPGKRFAQVESVAAIATISQKFFVELEVSAWATDEEVEAMNTDGRRAVYDKAIQHAATVLARLEQTITIKMAVGDTVPLRFVPHGKERFASCY